MVGYKLTIEPDDNATFLVTATAFPELTTFGSSRREAIDEAVKAVEEAASARISAGLDVPGPDTARGDLDGASAYACLPMLSQLKIGLYRALQSTGLNRAELGRRLGWHREQVDRLFRLDHASRLDQLESAARALGYVIDVQMTTEEPASAA